MQALVYVGRNALVLRDEPDPVPGDDEVVVEVDAVGICGSDMHAYHGHDERRTPPLILGHEAAGVATSGRFAGKRVTVNPLVTCRTCECCLSGFSHLCSARQILSMMPRPGAFAERVRVPEYNLVEVPEALDIAQAALAEPMAVSYHAVQIGLKYARRPASDLACAVLGGGAIGLGAALVLRMKGVGDICLAEPHSARRTSAARIGSFHVYEPGAVGEPESASIDVVIDAVGAERTRQAACKMIKPGGVIVHVGLLPTSGGLDVRRITLREIVFVGSYCYTMQEFRETVTALACGRLGRLDWFEQRPLCEGARAFADLDEGRTAAAKIVLRPR